LEIQETINSQGNTAFKLYYRDKAIKKKHGTGTKTDRKTSGTEQRNQIWIYIAIPTLFLTKAPKSYDGEKTASSTNVVGKTD
jgi:hypothetical protein